jgi:Transcriptional regulator DsbA
MTQLDNSEVPQDPEVRKSIRLAVAEASAVLKQVEDKKSLLKDIIDRAKDELGVPKKTFNKMVKAYHKQQYAAIIHENELFQTMYETVMEDPT